MNIFRNSHNLFCNGSQPPANKCEKQASLACETISMRSSAWHWRLKASVLGTIALTTMLISTSSFALSNIVVFNMAAKCSALMNAHLPSPGMSVTGAEVRDVGLPTEHCFVSSTFTLSGGQMTFKATHYLPKTFSQRYLQLGGGGFWPGYFDHLQDRSEAVGNLKDGMALGSFGGTVFDNLYWVDYNHYNEAYRAMTRDGLYYSTVIGKNLIKKFYGHAPKYSYYNGCSRGGQQGIAQALYHSDSYDGIAVNAPAFITQVLANYTPKLQDAIVYGGGANNDYPLFNGDLGKEVAKAIKQQCDGLDGTADGIISAPAACHPDFNTIFSDLNLTPGEQQLILDALKSHSYTGQPVDLSYSPVTVTEYGAPLTLSSYPILFYDNNWLVADSWAAIDPNADPTKNGDFWGNTFGPLLGMDFDGQGFANTMADLAVSPADGLFFRDLNAFAKHGGKMVLAHSWPDSLLYINDTIAWVDEQGKKFKGGAKALRGSTMRFFTTDTGGHCDFDQQAGLKAVMKWVEQGEAPNSLRLRASAVPYDRPACEFPKVPVRTKSNSNVLDFKSFSCLTPEQAAKKVTPVESVIPTVDIGIAMYNNQPASTFNGHEYKYVNYGVFNNAIVTLRLTWSESRSVCQGLGAGWDLATIHSQAENDFITNTVMGPEGYIGYLGGIYNYGDNNWYWIGDPNPFWTGYVGNVNQGFTGVFANWNGPQVTSSANNNEPNHYNGLPEDYVAIFGRGAIPGWGVTGLWMDTANSLNPGSPVCEK